MQKMMKVSQSRKVVIGLACIRCAKKHRRCSFVMGDTSKICNECSTAGVPCFPKLSHQGSRNDLHSPHPTIKSYLKTNTFLKKGSNTYAAAWRVIKKLHISEFNSKFGVVITIDSAYGNDKTPNVCSKKVLRNYFGETVSGDGGSSKMFHERCAYGTGSGATSVGIPDT